MRLRLWRVHAIVYMMCACYMHASGLCLLHVCYVLVIGLCKLCGVDVCVLYDFFVLALGWSQLCVLSGACIWLVIAVCLFCACVWLFMLVLLLLLLHLMLASARSRCLYAWARCVRGVRSSGWYHTAGLHRAFPGCDFVWSGSWGGVVKQG
jgi:hypothetical protein